MKFQNRPPTPVMEAAGIDTNSSTPPMSPRIGESPRNIEEPELDATALENVGHESSMLEAEHHSDLGSEPISRKNPENDSREDELIPRHNNELEAGHVFEVESCNTPTICSAAEEQSLQETEPVNSLHSEGAQTDDCVNTQNEDIQRIRKDACVEQSHQACVDNGESWKHESSGRETVECPSDQHREDEEDLEALMQELAELNPLRSPRSEGAAVPLTACQC